jgi:hypothetical protein
MAITLPPQVEAQAFGTYFRESVQKIRSKTIVSEDVKFSLYRPIEVVSSSVLTTQGLMGQWNERHGRFKKLSLESES